MIQDEKSLEKQLEWTKEKVRLLDEMDIRLRKMRKIAVFAKDNELSSAEIAQMIMN